jgi:DNA-directed RNA polymerase subunit H (RpoH/RPB5)
MDEKILITVCQTIVRDFLPARGLAPRSSSYAAVPGDAADADHIRLTLRTMNHFRIDAAPPDAAATSEATLTVAVIAGTGGGDVDKLLSSVYAGGTGDVILVATDEFFGKTGALRRVEAFRLARAGRRLLVLTPDPFATNPLKSTGVPNHRLLEEKEAEVVLEDLRLRPGELSQIYETDPPVIWLGGVAGEIVEIERRSVAGTALAYRVVRPARPLVTKSK